MLSQNPSIFLGEKPQNFIIKAISATKKMALTANQLLLAVCCYVTLVLNFPFLNKVYIATTSLSEYNIGFLLSVPLLLLSLTLILIGCLAIRTLLKPLLVFIVIISSLLFYATLTYGIVFDYTMVLNTVETDSSEALSYINLSSILFFLLFGVIPSVFIMLTEVDYQYEVIKRVKLIVIALLCVLVIGKFFYQDYASVGRNNRNIISYITPFKLVDSLYKFSKKNYFSSQLPFRILDNEPSLNSNSLGNDDFKKVTVLVVGETARANNFSLNGYAKSTNPFTKELNVTSFRNMKSCGTATAVSLPCMFSQLTRDDYEKTLANHQQNILDIVKLSGVDVLWIDNNNGSCKGVCNNVNSIDIATDKTDINCDGEYCFDEALLAPFIEKLDHLTHKNTLIVLHMIGSHGPTYYRRYPKSKRAFLPDCQRSDIQNCTEQELVNSYDNTIAYTDYVLSEVINQLTSISLNENIQTSMLYVSDHGESLGEKGVYLHGLPYAFAPEEQTHIPMIFWEGETHANLNKNCLNSLSNNPFSHDNIFDTLLGLLSVNSKTYNKGNDIFLPCKSKFLIAQNKVKNTKEIIDINTQQDITE